MSLYFLYKVKFLVGSFIKYGYEIVVANDASVCGFKK